MTPAPEPTLVNCDQEPIHIPGSIQPHGLLFVLREPGWEIVQVSANVTQMLGPTPGELLGQPLAVAFGEEQVARLQGWAEGLDLQPASPLGPVEAGGCSFYALAHRTRAGLILELEALRRRDAAPATSPEADVGLQNAVARLETAPNAQILCEWAAEEVRRFTGFDRVMVYLFDADWHGRVVAERRAPHVDSYLGLHFPSTDIPQQARRLYVLNRVRLIADVAYTPAPLVPAVNPLSGAPLDLSHSVLRSVSPIHIEYLQNMGVAASMSVSVVQGGQLQGLIACHHAEPLWVPYEARGASTVLGQVLALLLAYRQEAEERERLDEIRRIQSRLLEAMIRTDRFEEGLLEHPDDLLQLVNATGAAIYREGRIRPVGEVPEERDLHALVEALEAREEVAEEGTFATDRLGNVMSVGEPVRQIGSGLLAVPLSRLRKAYVLWFRPEVPQTVQWAGNPEKAVQVDASGELRLHPRKSFETWQATLRGRAVPWQESEIRTARELRGLITDVVFVKHEEIRSLNDSLKEANARLQDVNAQLAQRNRELQDFAYVASHDLQEPLRKIRTFAGLLVSDYSGRLAGEGLLFLERLESAAERMSQLIADLLKFSQVMTRGGSFAQLDLSAAAHEAALDLELAIEEAEAVVEIAPMPKIEADPAQMRRLFQHLLSNAIKFRHPERPPRISVSARHEPGQDRVAVRVEDNGMGFDEKYLDRAFLPFQRLHGRTYAGTGMGLAICRRIVERHGGSISATSLPDEGSVFIVTLPVVQEAGGAES